MFDLISEIVQKSEAKAHAIYNHIMFSEKNKEKSREFQTIPSIAKKYNPHRSLVKTAA